MKRFTICAVLLGFVVVSLLIARPALTDQQSEKKTTEPTKLEKLQKERIEALVKLVRLLEEQSLPGGLKTFSDFSKAQDELIQCKLEATNKPDERIALIEEQLKIAQGVFKAVENAVKIGFGHFTESDYQQAKVHCLTIEIKLVKERTDKKM